MPIPEFIVSLRERIGHDRLWLTGVTAVVLREDEVLLVKRSDNGAWTPVTGICDPGEEPATTAAREALEEACIVARPERLLWVHVLDPITYPNGDEVQYLDLVFRCSYVSGDAVVGDDESTEVGWFGLDALPPLSERHLEAIRLAVENAPEAVFVR